MKTIEAPWSIVGKFVGLVFGIPFSLIGLLWYVQDGNAAFLSNGVLWAGLGAICVIKGKLHKYQLKRLEKEGVCYDCSVVKIIPANMIRIGSYLTVRAECIYESDRTIHSVISGLYLLSPLDRIENLNAKIYVDKDNSKKWVLVLFRKKDIFTL